MHQKQCYNIYLPSTHSTNGPQIGLILRPESNRIRCQLKNPFKT